MTSRDVYVNGVAKSLVCSVSVPTEDLTFILDPNQDERERFIAPTFSLINETPASIRVTLKSFEQETDVFRDVLPTEYTDWSQLNKNQSKDIALALVPIRSDGWLTVDETPRYVANHSSVVLGEIKAKSTVDLTFEALHGQAFIENLNSRYKLVFVFDF